MTALLLTGIALAVPGARAASLHIVDNTFDTPPVARLFLVDPTTGDLTLEADLDGSYAPYLGLAAIDATHFYASGTDARCGAGLQGCVLLEVELTPPSTVPTITPVGTITDGGTGLMLIGVVGLTFRGNGVLYAISEDTDRLYVLDPSTAEATLVGPSGIDLHGGDITFDAEGRLWDWTNIGSASGLYQMNTGSGTASLADNSPDLSFTGLAALGHGNTMYGCSPDTDTLYGVDPSTGLNGIELPLHLDGSSYALTRGDMDSPACESDAACDDGEICTTDICLPGGCSHAPVAECCHTDGECDDANPCTDDSCQPGSVCAHQPHEGSPEVCDGIDNDCDGTVDQGLPDGDGDGVCDGIDNCPAAANPGQQDLDDDGAGDACDFGLASPGNDEILDCTPGATAPMIVWSAGAYDRFRVVISWLPDYSRKITSGDTLLKVSSWRPSPTKWRKVCDKAVDGVLHIRVLGVDRDRPRSDPLRKVYTAEVSAGVQH